MAEINRADRKVPAMAEEGAVARFLRATEIDTRMLGMVARSAADLGRLRYWTYYRAYVVNPDGLLGGSFPDAAQSVDAARPDLRPSP